MEYLRRIVENQTGPPKCEFLYSEVSGDGDLVTLLVLHNS